MRPPLRPGNLTAALLATWLAASGASAQRTGASVPVTIRERVEVTGPASTSNSTGGWVSTNEFTVRVVGASTNCGWGGCFDPLPAGAAYVFSGTRPDGTPFQVSVPVADHATLVDQYTLEGGCSSWGTGVDPTRGVMDYDGDGTTVSLGEVGST